MKIWIKLSTILALKESELIKFCITNFVCSHYIKVSRNYVFLHKFLQIPPLGSINNTSRQKQWAEDQNKYPFLKCSICEKKNSKRAHFWLRYYRNQTGYLPALIFTTSCLFINKNISTQLIKTYGRDHIGTKWMDRKKAKAGGRHHPFF